MASSSSTRRGSVGPLLPVTPSAIAAEGVDPAVKSRIDAEHVGPALGLTRAESRLAAALAQGMSVRDCAAAQCRAESSVRWLIKQIHSKLKISRNTDLVRMVLTAAWGYGVATLKPSSGGNNAELSQTSLPPYADR